MVVTRRTPVPPVPTSRTNSSQPIPRVAKGPTTTNVPDISSPLARAAVVDDGGPPTGPRAQANGKAVSPSKNLSKAKSKQKKGKKKSRGKGRGFVELLTRAFLLWFTIYTLSVCPDDIKLKSPICRGLSEYRRLVVDPYILPPLQLALAHPSVAPYVEKAQPYADYAIRTVKPVASRAQYEWNARVIPQFNKHVVPLWQQYAVPQIKRVDAHIAPYRSQLAREYELRLGPRVRIATQTLHRLQNQIRPYVFLAAQKTHAGYVYAKPYARPVWEKFTDLLLQLAAVIGEQRRKFVDPHVQRIWERVKELSGKPKVPNTADVRGTTKSSLTKAAQSVSSVASSASSALPVLSKKPFAKPISVAEAVSSSASEAKSTISETVASVTSSTVIPAKTISLVSSRASDASAQTKDTAASVSSAANSSGASLSSSGSSLSETASSSISSVASVPGTSVQEFASSVVPSFTQELAFSASSIGSTASDAVVEGLASASESVLDAESTAVAALSSVVASGAATVSVADEPTILAALEHDAGSDHLDEVDLDLDAFYAELGLDDEIVSETPTPSAPEPVPAAPRRTETEEEKAERLRLRAEQNQKKRVELDGRRDQWEKELAQKIETNKKALRKALVALRKAASAELKDNKQIRDELKGLETEAEKLLKGVEKYLQTLRKEGKTADDKLTFWDKVVEKVGAKFVEKLGEAEAVVNGWYLTVLNKELDEVRRLTAEVHDIADKAQTDLGMDYSYLDDVTWQDWQRYHDLARASENFTALAATIQDGTHPSPPINPVFTAIKELEAEVQDVALGFETRLRTIRRNGERAFADDSQSSGGETVSILPVDEDHTESSEQVHVPPVVIGKSKEEVMAALNRVAEQEGQATSSPDESGYAPEAEVLVEQLAQTEESISVPSPLHEEL